MRGDCSTCSYYGNCPGLSALCVGWTPSWVSDNGDEYDEEEAK